MVDPLYIFLSLLHLVALFGGAAFVFRRWGMDRRDLPFAVVTAAWAVLVLASHGASLFGALDHLGAFVLMNILAFAAFFGACWRIQSAPVPVGGPLLSAPSLDFVQIQNPKLRRFLTIFLLVTLGLIAVASFAIGTGVYPDNADSMIYRLPRAFWYVSHGSFLHPFEATDKRLTYYPLNGVAIYVPIVLYNLTGNVFVLPSLLMWALVVYAAYRFARALGAEKILALLTAWLVATTPSILAQATSTNDELLAAASLLFAMYLGWRWLVSGQRLYLFLGVTAAGLSVGTKMHVVYLAPVLLVVAFWAVRYARKNAGTWNTWRDQVGARTWFWGSVSLVVMIFPFFVYNYISAGRFYFFEDFVGDVFNLGASFRGAWQNLLIYVSQMVLAPIADMNFWPVANTRQQFNTNLNMIFNPMIAPLLDPDPKYYHMHYRFVGITIPVSVRFVEFSLWSAFVWLLWPFQARLALRQKFALRGVFFLLALLPPLWLLMWAATTLYMEGTATYFTYFLVCAIPSAVFAFGTTRRRWTHELRWIVVGFVAATNLLISGNLLMYSGFRALPDLYYSRTWPYDWDLVDQSVIDELRLANHIRIAQTHDKMPYFAYMHWHPKAKYYTPYPVKTLPEAEKILQVLPVSSLYEYGFMPLKIPGKRVPGVTYIGTIRAIGREAIFAVGNNVAARNPSESDYVILQTLPIPDDSGEKWTFYIPPEVPGLTPSDNLLFKYEILLNKEVIYETDWSKSPALKAPVTVNPAKGGYSIRTSVRAGWNNTILTQATYRVGGAGAWLKDDMEY